MKTRARAHLPLLRHERPELARAPGERKHASDEKEVIIKDFLVKNCK